MPAIQDISAHLESIAPLNLQESYDNAGLIVGNPKTSVTGVICTLDSTEDVIEEAIKNECNLVVAHHPIVFSGLKKLNGSNYIERTIIKAIKHDIAIYAIHTNLDNVSTGVNAKICQKLGLDNIKILNPSKEKLIKLAVFIPQTHTEVVLKALGEAGAGKIGDYKNCSFSVTGEGRFQSKEQANPFLGKAGNLEKVKEDKIEVVLPASQKNNILKVLRSVHPYEEIAYDTFSLLNNNPDVGSGMIGSLPKSIPAKDFLMYLKKKMELGMIRHTALLNKTINKVAVCGGSGSFLLSHAMRAKADIFITADYKYHQFFDADSKIIIADIGHYESEKYTKELLASLIMDQFESLKVIESTVVTNPVFYY